MVLTGRSYFWSAVADRRGRTGQRHNFVSTKGFCEFHDHETAASAVRNLNNYDMGGRTLRVDFAENEKPGGPSREREDGARGAAGSSTFQQSPQYGGPASGAQPGMAYGAPPPSAGGGIGVQDPAVAKALALFTNEQLMELMSQMKVGRGREFG